MKLRLSIWSVVVVAVALSSVVLLSSGPAMASNMGFKMNKVIAATGASGIGQNRVALPYKNPYQSALDACQALGLSLVAPQGVVRQVNAQTGVTSVCNCNGGAAACGPAAFPLADRVGIRVTNPSAAGGILVGSHASNPPGNVTLYSPVAAGTGQNDFPVPYHTTAVTLSDLCVDLGITGAAHPGVRFTQLDAASNVSCILNGCAAGSPCLLKLGESILINGLSSNVVVAPGHPAHF